MFANGIIPFSSHIPHTLSRGAIVAALALGLTAAAAAPAQGARLKTAATSPGQIFFAGKHDARFTYRMGGSKQRDLEVEVVRRADRSVVKRWTRPGIKPDQDYSVAWGGRKAGGGEAPSGGYTFRVREAGGPVLDATNASGQRAFDLRGHRFPVPAPHTYGDGYGAGRNHQGQDIFAKCGSRMLAARAGRVVFVGKHSAAGHYVVIRGAGTGKDYVYMHLRRKTSAREGFRVKTGQQIGKVGATGNASGCHLHFELWSKPGWYQGGKASPNIRKVMRRWDRYS